MRPRAFLLIILAICTLTAMASRVLLSAQPPNGAPQGCESKINGWERPDLVPSHLAWEDAFTGLAAGDIALIRAANADPQTAAEITGTARRLIALVRQVRADSAIDVVARDAEVAAKVLDARDGLIRSMPAITFAALSDAISGREQSKTFAFAVRARPTMINGSERCQLTVTGRDYPHLIPEPFAWEWYFQFRAGIAKPRRSAAGEYPVEFITALRGNHLQVSPYYVHQILNAAIDANDRIESLRQADPRPATIAATVMEDRANLVRSLPITVWSVLKADVARNVVGAAYTFPPSF